MALHQIVKPHEARHDFDIFAGLCKRFDMKRCTVKTGMKCSGYRRFMTKV
jgi:hypothetical protein